MSINLRDELNKLSSTAPVLKDIDEYSDDDTKAKVIEKSNEYGDELDFNVTEHSRRIRAPIADLSEYGTKYKGKPTSRKEINSGDEDLESESDDSEEEIEDDSNADEDDDLEDGNEEEEEEEMDESEEEEIEEVERKNHQKKSTRKEPLKLSNYNQKEEIEKGKAVKNQLNLWDNLVETRVRLQNVLNVVNQLPQYDQFEKIFQNLSEESKSNNELNLIENQKCLKKCMNQLIEVQQRLIQQVPETNYILKDLKMDENVSGQSEPQSDPELKRKRINSEGSSSEESDNDDEEIFSDTDEEMRAEETKRAKKEKKNKTFHFNYMEPDQFEDYLAKFNSSFLKYRDSTLQKWYDKTRLTTGKSFESLEKPILQQIEHILLDKERIIRRTQLKRGQYKICGKEDQAEDEVDLESLKNRHLKDYDVEIFDDQDFYNQLLRELIERKSNNISDPIELSRKSIELQKLRAKNKKKVDTKASKGRKIKFDVHKPLVNFMAPIYRTSMSDEARNELFRSLFGRTEEKEKQNTKNNDLDFSTLFKGF